MSQIQMTAQDVKVNFKHNGKTYGDDRFIIQIQAGEKLEDKIVEQVSKSRYALDGVDFDLEIECRELAVA